jgi:hypothetical protein
MLDILRSNDPVVLNLAQAVLRDARIGSFLADQHMSIVEGSIGAFPRRLQVHADDWTAARKALSEAGLQAWLVSEADRGD